MRAKSGWGRACARAHAKEAGKAARATRAARAAEAVRAECPMAALEGEKRSWS